MKRNLSVTKSNYLIEASYKINLQAQKLILACLAKIDPRKDVPKEITITAKEYAQLMEVSNAHRELYLAADTLFGSVIRLKNNNEELELYWIQKKVKKMKGEGSVTLTWSDDVLAYISSLRGHFTSYPIHKLGDVQSTHSIRLYELLMRYKDTGERVITLEQFKFALGIAEKYPLFKDLNKRVIKPSIMELNSVMGLDIKCELIKKNRCVRAISFEFKKQNKK